MSSLQDLKNQLHHLADKNIAAHSQRFFKTAKGEYAEGDLFLGIRVPVLRKLAKQYQNLTITQIVSLLKSKLHEQRLLALIMLVHKYKKADPANKEKIYNVYMNNTRYINNWDLVDSSAHHIVGHYLSDRDKQCLFDLAASDSLWERRISVIATFYFIRKNKFKTCLKICTSLLNDDEDLIHKACGWMLREIGKRDKKTETAFLHQHASKMPRTMLRYAIERFPADERKNFLLRKSTLKQ